MGIVNVTPDSFSDGALYFSADAAIARGLELAAAGADVVDVGGETTRPGSTGIDVDEELARVIPVVAALAGAGIVVSVDTSKAKVADRAIAAGAAVVNDVTALSDPDMAGVVAAGGAGVVLMHMQGTPRTMQDSPSYEDVVGEVVSFLVARAARAEESGISRDRICIDPGIGFGKRHEHNLALLGHLDALVATGYPVLVGVSRKSFLGRITGIEDPGRRDVATGAALALAVERGAFALRVHNVVMAVQIARTADAIVRLS